jgi:hypothetical protein
MTDLDAYTDEGLTDAMAYVLAHAHGEVLNDDEVREFWHLHQEMLRRRAPSETAAGEPILAPWRVTPLGSGYH